GTLVTNSPQVTVSGVTEPGATVKLGTGSDTNFGEGTTTADSAGHYAFSVTLSPGVNTLRTQSSDAFGQSRVALTQVTLDTQAPTITITSPAPNLVTSNNITIAGLVTDDLSGVASLTAQLDQGAPVAVAFDATGHFRFTTNLATDDSAVGPHTVAFVAADGAG